MTTYPATLPCAGCGRTIDGEPEGDAPAILLLGPIPAAWCLRCVDALPTGPADEVFDAAAPAEWHRCEVAIDDTFYGDGGFCRYCGAHLSYIGSAGYWPLAHLAAEE